MKGWLIFVAATACVVVAGLGFRKALRAKLTRLARLATWTACVVLGGVGGSTIGYPLDERTRVYGFPFPSVVLQREPDGTWLDFVGPLTMPFACLNAVVGTGVLLYAAVTLLSYLVRLRGARAAGAGA